MKNFDLDNEMLCRVAWSIISNPCTPFVGKLVKQFGARKSLKMLLLDNFPKEYLPKKNFSNSIKILKDKLENADPELELKRFFDKGGSLLTPTHKLWPKGFRHLGWQEPLCLWALDKNIKCLEFETTKYISIVGSRNMSSYGLEVCRNFAEHFSKKGYIIVSGGAYGVDIVSHKVAVDLKNPTISIMASGLNKLYPAGNLEVFEKILKNGLIISESPPDSDPRKERFLTRNRLVAGISVATVVIEAGYRSGAINTAAHASNYGRISATVPGSVLQPYSAGCHRLITEGVSILTTDPEDLESLINNSEKDTEKREELNINDPLAPKHQELIDLLKPIKPTTANELATILNKNIIEILQIVSKLEQQNYIKQKNGGWILSRYSEPT